MSKLVDYDVDGVEKTFVACESIDILESASQVICGIGRDRVEKDAIDVIGEVLSLRRRAPHFDDPSVFGQDVHGDRSTLLDTVVDMPKPPVGVVLGQVKVLTTAFTVAVCRQSNGNDSPVIGFLVVVGMSIANVSASQPGRAELMAIPIVPFGYSWGPVSGHLGDLVDGFEDLGIAGQVEQGNLEEEKGFRLMVDFVTVAVPMIQIIVNPLPSHGKEFLAVLDEIAIRREVMPDKERAKMTAKFMVAYQVTVRPGKFGLSESVHPLLEGVFG